jgi:hypothetical protein
LATTESGENDEPTLIIRNSVTGEVLRGDNIPEPDEVDEWLARNPGYELISRDTASDSDDDPEEEEIPVQSQEDREDEFEGLIVYLILI